MKEYYQIEKKEFDRANSISAIKLLFKHPEFGSLWMIKRGGISIGYFCLAYNYSLDIGGRDCFLDEIYIEEQHRRLGIGTLILEQISDFLRKNEFKGIHLLVYDFNAPAIHFYEKLGFIPEHGKFMTLNLR
jgi:GNAT superfamily N-acetyltransferase